MKRTTLERGALALGLLLCVGLVPFMEASGDSGRPAPVSAPAPGASEAGTPVPVEPVPAEPVVPAEPAAPDLPATRGAAGVPGMPQVPADTRCVGGTSGKRVQALYVHGARQRSRITRKRPVFQRYLQQVDAAFVRAAKEHGGGVRRVRYLRDDQCRVPVTDVTIPQDAMRTVDTVTAAIKAQGYHRADRKYIVWYDMPGCGVGFGAGGNDDAGWHNRYNFGPHYAAIGTDCWGWGPTLHELLHILGAVQSSAPHATENGHCWDDEDVMCYDDQSLPKGGLQVICKKGAGGDIVGNQIDCNGDDYFNTKPAPGSYLATHWNVADSDYLSRE